jgi:anaerobic magnesium-protoporphyrin IX monomethyl ester cyclase
VIRHDGELSLVALLDSLDTPDRWPEIEGVCTRDADGRPVAAPPRRQPDDLDALPFPLRDRPHVEHVGLKFTPIVGSRGCFADCNYCCINSWHRTSNGKRYRKRSPQNLADEMAYLYHDRDVRIFCFHDETIFFPKAKQSIERLIALDAELRRRRVGHVGINGKCRPDQLSLELLQVAKACGVYRLYLGVENGSEAGLRHLNRKHVRADCVRALELLRTAGVFACYNVLLFEPDTRFSDLWENVELIERFTDFPFNFCRTEVYSGSRYQRILADQGRLAGNYLGYSYEIADPRAELAFRLASVCFRNRNFSIDGVANLNTGMGYEAAVLRHFYGRRGQALAGEVDRLVREVNVDTIAFLRRLLEFASRCDLDRPDRACDFAERLAIEINFRDLELGNAQRALRARVKEFGQALVGSVIDRPRPAPTAPALSGLGTTAEDVTAPWQGGI